MRKAGHRWEQGRAGKFHELIPSSNKAFGSESKGPVYLSVLLMGSSGSILYSKVNEQRRRLEDFGLAIVS